MTDRESITDLLHAYARGDQGAVAQLFTPLYDELRRVAHRQLSARGRGNQTLNTTALVHEAWMKLEKGGRVSIQDRRHFFALAAKAMRQVVIDYARRVRAPKRGGDRVKVTLDEGTIAIESQAEHLLELDEAVAGLAQIDERLAAVIECRFFAGLTEQETADALGCSIRTVQRLWQRARAWLQADISP